MKSTIDLVEAALAAEIAEARIDTLVGCLRRMHAAFGSDVELFAMLERDLLAEQTEVIMNEVQSRFYESRNDAHVVFDRAVNPAWNLD